MRYTVTEYRD